MNLRLGMTTLPLSKINRDNSPLLPEIRSSYKSRELTNAECLQKKYLCLCPGLQSTMDEEERDDLGLTAKSCLSGEHGRQSKAKR